MGKIRLSSRSGAAILLAAGLAACQGAGEVDDARPALDQGQQAELTAYVQAYHRCVARTAVRLDDGHSAIVRVAGMAMSFCEPEARIVAAFLNTTPLASDIKLDYVAHLLAIAANNSALMLRRRRDLEGALEDI